MRLFANTRIGVCLGCGLAAWAWLCPGATAVHAQGIPVTVQVEIVNRSAGSKDATAGHSADASNVALWLEPLDQPFDSIPRKTPAQPPQIVQRNKAFEPHVLVVEVGTKVEFPNKDPFFHNVFSLYNGRRFDLGLYEAGETRAIRFDRPGVSYLFCNIHAEMSAVVVAVETPYFGLSDHSGHVSIPDVPKGRYQLRVWYERSLPDELKGLTRTVEVSDPEHATFPVRITANPNFTLAHKNKYGQDYVPPPDAGYSHP